MFVGRKKELAVLEETYKKPAKEYKEDPEFDAWCDRVIDSLEKAKEAI